MATIRILFRPGPSDRGKGTIVYRIIHNRDVRRIASGLSLSADLWDASLQCVSVSSPQGRSVKLAIDWHLDILRHVIESYESRDAPFSVSDIVDSFHARIRCPTFADFARKEIARRVAMNCRRISSAYASSIARFTAFAGDAEVAIDSVSPELIETFQRWLIDRGLCNNTISFYMRNLRAIYNRAVRQGLTSDNRPFASVFTGIDKTRKRAISRDTMKRIKNLDLSGNESLCRARDLFMLSFYCMGISFIDLAFLKKSNLSQGRVTYRRSKTRQTISFSVNKKIQLLFDKYAAPAESVYLLDIISDPDIDPRLQYEKALNYANRRLKKVGRLAGIDTTLTTYVTRHSWASLAKASNVSINVISDALGHDNESTTQIYLASLDTDRIDRANNLVTHGI